MDPVKDIPLDSQEVMSLFQNTSALGIAPDDIGGCSSWEPLGIPEFGTDFAMQMFIDAKPKYFSGSGAYLPDWHMVRTYGWAMRKTLSQAGEATIQTAICTRDDIMVYLIQMGLEGGLSFTHHGECAEGG